MKLKAAKTYALDELRLERDYVRTFGKLSATQTWLDAIAAAEAAVEDDILDLLGSDELPAVEVEVTEEVAEEPAETAEPEDCLIAFWESEPEQQAPQPLVALSSLDEAWDDPEPRSPGAAAVVVYPLVILLMMLWAMVQVLLLSGKGLCWVLGELGQQLDVMAQKHLQERRESRSAGNEPELNFAMT